ncbi:hypothetical protein ISREJYDI_CDS0128 [Pseudomonas phage UNO-G1W1]|uniref:Uncharacterized protein n=1 Tax=Pseudomonas phage UNO-G1W1 TaxID=3136609 RepID=A0AAX4MW85_9CAUD
MRNARSVQSRYPPLRGMSVGDKRPLMLGVDEQILVMLVCPGTN